MLLADWGRDHHLGWFVAQAENVYYAHIDTVKTGGEPTISTTIGDGGALRPSPSPSPARSPHASMQSPHASTKGSGKSPHTATKSSHAAPKASHRPPVKPAPAAAAPAAPPAPPPDHLSPPPTVESPVDNPLKNEGVWQPVAAAVGGVPAIYAKRVRADDVHTSVLASMMWIDTQLTKAMFVPGYIEPGGPSPSNGALPKALDPRVLANVNGAFRLQDTHAGYYFQGRTIRPLVKGRASTVLKDDGSIAVGSWGRDVRMSADVVAVRQNLDLVVDGGRSQVGRRFCWGATTHGETFAWRSAIGERSDGSIVYIGSPGLSAAGMADTLVRGGCRTRDGIGHEQLVGRRFLLRPRRGRVPEVLQARPGDRRGLRPIPQPLQADSFQFLARY